MKKTKAHVTSSNLTETKPYKAPLKGRKLCVACEGKGVSTRGWPCYPCNGKGFKV